MCALSPPPPHAATPTPPQNSCPPGVLIFFPPLLPLSSSTSSRCPRARTTSQPSTPLFRFFRFTSTSAGTRDGPPRACRQRRRPCGAPEERCAQQRGRAAAGSAPLNAGPTLAQGP